MYAQVSRVTVHPGKIDEVMAALHAHGLPALTGAQGFAGGLWLYDPETLRGMQIILWQSEEDIERLATNGAGEEAERLWEPLMEMQPPELCVALHREEMPDGARPAFAVVVVPPVRSGAQEEAIGIWRAAVLPVLKQQEGYAGSVVLVDRMAGQMLDMSLWASDTAIQAAAQRNDLRQATEQLAAYLVGEPTAHLYRVLHQE